MLKQTIEELLKDSKGLLAMDESTPTCNKRFAALGIPQTEEYRRKYRDLIVNAPDLEKYIGGAILFEETTKQSTNDGTPFITVLQQKGIIPGIKVDEGAVDLAGFKGEKITQGLDGLAARLAEYKRMGLLFAKWRAVITIDHDLPTITCIKANAFELARYAVLCQEEGIVPIVEPEVVMDGNHSLKKCTEVTTEVLHNVFNALYHQRVSLDEMILKPNMILPGQQSTENCSAEDVAHATINCFLKTVPASVPGIAFLSGGQPAQQASERLNTMHQLYDAKMPWKLSFSYSRAVQQPALEYWAGKDENVAVAQQKLVFRAYCNSLANQGKYTADTEIENGKVDIEG